MSILRVLNPFFELFYGVKTPQTALFPLYYPAIFSDIPILTPGFSVVIWAWWVLYVAITIYSTCNWDANGGKSGFLLIPREKQKHYKALPADEESQPTNERPVVKSSGGSSSDETLTNVNKEALVRNTSVFTWKNLTYTVPTPSGPRVLLDDVQGWVRPGQLGALMGSSGAGKTTLLDVLAQRKTDGTVKGSIQVDGRPLTVSFQRSAGYCEQRKQHFPFFPFSNSYS